MSRPILKLETMRGKESFPRGFQIMYTFFLFSGFLYKPKSTVLLLIKKKHSTTTIDAIPLDPNKSLALIGLVPSHCSAHVCINDNSYTTFSQPSLPFKLCPTRRYASLLSTAVARLSISMVLSSKNGCALSNFRRPESWP